MYAKFILLAVSECTVPQKVDNPSYPPTCLVLKMLVKCEMNWRERHDIALGLEDTVGRVRRL